MTDISFSKLVALIIKETIAELRRRGISFSTDEISQIVNNTSIKSEEKLKIDFSGYKTPLLNEERVLSCDEKIKEIEIPENTVFTPSAYDIIKKRNIKITKYKKE